MFSLTNSDSVILGDNLCDVEGDVGGGLEYFHLDLDVSQDAEVAVDERLKFDQVVERLEGSWQSHVHHPAVVPAGCGGLRARL